MTDGMLDCNEYRNADYAMATAVLATRRGRCCPRYASSLRISLDGLIELINEPSFSSGEYHPCSLNFSRKSRLELEWKIDIEPLTLLQFLISCVAPLRQDNVLEGELSLRIRLIRW